MPAPTGQAPLLVFAVDARGVVTMSAGAGLQAIGREPMDAIGQPLSAAYPDNAEIAAAAQAALAGERVVLRTPIAGRTFELLLVPQRGPDDVVIGVVGAGYDVTEELREPGGPARTYDIRIGGDDFGIVLDAWQDGRRLDGAVGLRCHAIFHGSDSPCAGCPARHVSPEEAATRVEAKDGEYPIMTAEQTGPTTVRLRVRSISDALLTDLIQARIEVIAAAARLTAREREVLQLMLLGRTSADIGRALAITERTAKFHQANVQRKIGAESRLDLQRIILQTNYEAAGARSVRGKRVNA